MLLSTEDNNNILVLGDDKNLRIDIAVNLDYYI